ncbi:S-layer homology domain-containing protein [Paenibacillus radicis (ex Gao et al. 2016)]|uniref:SLH domain-containing protein n=1 Tax=Paenibacillus radicis (ex Gao et al. 2016) TaxID=1737354 RepID=A0A917M8G9_9BACL|nr:S-layer homology domain-containing protein [Paenibacillus radicis (ex Gao et al. 2016)]GGG81881.1 hypothetical protein GCM10010918_44000 [Paenibacillus radicis (ex Gao et al. 2016)]
MKKNRFLAWLLIVAVFLSVFSTNLTVSYASTGLGQTYTDSASISQWAKASIDRASELGFVQGSNGKFNPKSSVTRAEFAKMLVSVLNIPMVSKPAGYADVASNQWYYPYINAVSQAGYMSGYNQKFEPNASITREQMAATIVRALGLKPVQTASLIADADNVSAWAKADVTTILASQIMLGDNNRFNPQGTVTREMAAVVAMRTFDYGKPSETDPETPVVSPIHTKVKTQVKETAAFLQSSVTNPVIASVGGEWTVFGLARSGIKLPDAYYAKYYANVEKKLKEVDGKLHNVKYTEYDRVILALTAIGKGVDHVAGYNLREPLADYETLIKQGINGPIFALIALDSKNYEIPTVAKVKTQTTRELLIDFILNREIAGGGWALGEKPTAADPDITSMAIQAFAPYYATNEKVKAAVDRGIAWLSKVQQADGGYASGGSANSESTAQVIVALTALRIDPHTDARFVKNGHSVVDALLSYAAKNKDKGGFYHVKSGGVDNGGAKPGDVDLMATDQAFYALVAYDRFLNGQTRLYDMTDVKA